MTEPTEFEKAQRKKEGDALIQNLRDQIAGMGKPERKADPEKIGAYLAARLKAKETF